MKTPLFLLLMTGLLAVAAPARAEVVETFGTGKGGLAAAGSGSLKLASAGARASVRFSAATGGGLTDFDFGANAGPGFSSGQKDAFSVTLHDDQGGVPGKEIARASVVLFNDGGARVRTARFSPGAAVRAGGVYHLVIACAQADAAGHVFGVEYALLGRDVVPVDAFDMERADPSAALLSSADAGGSWTPVPYAIAAHAVVIAGKSQGWGYTGTVEFALKRGPSAAQYAMQTFRFDPARPSARGVPQRLHLSLRPQGALAGRPVKVFAEIVTPVGFHTVAEASAEVTLANAARFDPVVLPFSGGPLVAGANYVLIVGLAEEVTAGPKDFLFMRGYGWGIGSPNLHALSWQGAAGCAHVSPDASGLGAPNPGADIPFLIDYLPAK